MSWRFLTLLHEEAWQPCSTILQACKPLSVIYQSLEIQQSRGLLGENILNGSETSAIAQYARERSVNCEMYFTGAHQDKYPITRPSFFNTLIPKCSGKDSSRWPL